MAGRVRRALVSVFEKEGVVSLCRGLHAMAVEILSSGGTAELLEAEGIPAVPVSEVTGFPEMLDGRVKTLHPRIHGGILAIRSSPRHVSELKREGIEPIDLVVVNLYPFEKTASREGADPSEVLERIDIGGPALVRAAAKNHEDVAVVVDPADYDAVLAEIREAGAVSPGTRLRLAHKAFRHTSAYDAAVAAWFSHRRAGDEDRKSPSFPERLVLDFVQTSPLGYGENPHQAAAFYRDAGGEGGGLPRAAQLQGKPLSFNNVLDFDAGLGLAADLGGAGCVIVKHGNPCGAALSDSPVEAFRRALECDPVSAFGGIVAFNRPADGPAAEAIAEAFYEGVLAPSFTDGARQALSRKKNLRLLATGDISEFQRAGYDLRRVQGGLLVQEWDTPEPTIRTGRVVTRRPPTEAEWGGMEFAWRIVRHVKSNAIVYAFADRTAGIGAGQMSRVDSARLGVQKARLSLRGAAMASDAFFPFRDSLDIAAEAGVTSVVQPGGSIRDAEIVAAADEHGMAMVLTGRRHFRH